MNVGIISLGCPKNLIDSEILLGQLGDRYTIVHNPADADVVLINTCSFVEDAREESVQMILELVEMKEQGTIKHIVVCGCLPQKYGDDIEKEIPEIDAMIGTFSLTSITECLENLAQDDAQKKFISQEQDDTYQYNAARYFLTPQHTKYIKIAEGCDHACSFCIIPQLRGSYISRPMEAIVAEARALIAQGTKELVLIAQDTTYYGVDLYKKRMLAELLKQLNALEGCFWIRVLYFYPTQIDDALLTVMAESEHVCKYIDMPIQHVNDRILKCMNRPMTQEWLENLIATIRSMVPGVVIRTSVIVGYPGETYEEFNELLRFIPILHFHNDPVKH